MIYEPTDKKLQLVFEFVDMDLKRYLIKHNKLSHEEVKRIMYQLIVGLHHCHSKRIIHRDVKPQNILINESGTVKVADFGLARAFGIPIRTLTH